MYEFHSLQELHLELTERCNAGCPMCGRYQDSGTENVNLASRELSLEDIKSWIPKEFLINLERIRMCGNFGDPAVAKDSLAICEYLRMRNPSIKLSFHSNGGLRDPEWWFKLGRLFNSSDDEIYFALDGLEETLPLYRRGVQYERVIKNASASIRAGARCHWVMLVFDHNEHEIDKARELAKSMGFASFRLKATKRFLRSNNQEFDWNWPVKEISGETLYSLSAPKLDSLKNPALIKIANKSEAAKKVIINCHTAQRKSLYISAEGLVFPCCWTAAAIYPSDKKGPNGEFADLLAQHAGINSISLQHHSIPALWAKSQPQICAKTCNKELDSFRAQFIENTDFSSKNKNNFIIPKQLYQLSSL
jgi:MoaA/NifB/PqqE/SkfB family radical SAM enzyme